jgi:hypothetical protein
MGIVDNALMGASGQSGYNLTRSLRFRASATAYLYRTLTSNSTSQTTMTWSGWVKRGALGTARAIITYHGNLGGSGNMILMEFNADTLRVLYDGGAATGFTTSQVFRDPAAWYHIILVYDSTQATSSNRSKLYVNGSQVTSFSSITYPSLNQAVNNVSTTIQTLANLSSLPFDGYFAEVNFVDGQALTPSSFGSTNTITGVWQPKKYTGTYGTNGYYLPFTDNSALTTSSNVGLGRDFSGNGNYFPTYNISITAGATYDSMTDVPTLTSTTAANYCVMNPLQPQDSGYTTTRTNGNLATSITYNSGPNMVTVPASMKTPSSGKWYWEITATSTQPSGGSTGIGLTTAENYIDGASPPTSYYIYLGYNGSKFSNGTTASYGATYTTNDVIGVALDIDSGTLTFYKNNVSQGTAYTGLAATNYCAIVTSNATGTRSYASNFGQQPFTYTPPTGFLPLNTYNI